MGLLSDKKQESYELVDSSQFNDIDLERGEGQSQDHQPEQTQSRVSSESTRSTSRSSINSQTSELLQGINRYTDINDEAEDFTSSSGYLNANKGGVRRKLWISVIFAAVVALWVVGLFGYSVGAKKSNYHYTPSKTSNQSSISTSTTRLKIPTRTALPLVEYDIHKERDPLPTESIVGDIIIEPIDFLDSGSLNITKDEDEGIYLSSENRAFILKKSSDRQFQQVLYDQDKFSHDNHEHEISDFKPSYTVKYAIVGTNKEAEFRHSGKSLYWLYNIELKTFQPLSKDGKESKLSLAIWSPKFNYISFVQDNNLYVYDVKTSNVKQISTDGKSDILNGKTDWVYEEEVLATDSAIWWSPDESNLIYMRTDDTKVKDHDLEFFIEDDQFPKVEKLKYPKPGGANPLVSLHNYNIHTGENKEVDRSGSTLGDDFVIYGCQWLDSENFIVRETNRESKILNYRHLSSRTGKTSIIHTVDALKEYNGWIEKFSDMVPISKNEKFGRSNLGFIDTIVVDGYNHLGLFEITDGKAKVIPLTKGDWETTSGALAYDQEQNKIFFTANRRSSFENHLYSVDIGNQNMTSLTDTNQLGYYTVSFSPTSRHNVITKDGPELPLMYGKDRLHKRASVHNFFGEDISYHKVKVDEDEDGNPVTVNVVEVLPKGFKPNGTHPLLVNVYGGPGSKKVSSKFQISFEDTVGLKTNAVILYIDPRGTGGQGWKYRSWANGHIGYWEPRDITEVTREWIDSRPYIDEDQTAIWGWSYGGFSTLKTLEFDGGNVFKYGMAVAPVTDWTLYDSIYTERYMGQPKDNEVGYHESRVNNVYAFKDVKRFLVMHGTGDDNVHVQNSLRLFDKFNLASVANFDMKVYPDSNHNIDFHNANAIVYKKLETWLVNAFEGHFDNLIYA
ncbi:hypothetical protein BN7_3813 [Wickerhamomyces ciferrii]|uniref:Uncharacterized protein n=1 Tax=Wickerhamomyces ciferrii (strain ATCC 14091 / BCRC 22168 / CBS 111 / JCM 3599 / NBRC 0793 / NRRL Y-1031 F-60-10) TaxID=1206466 RepID=K0KQ09_WICCF|nr:uncharacterized protein BN7_3813 [Wickerhamomyces ciferrii]CCH44252.1 hypothetical protein BN7_3813 [Wickerhamomyces ciferrii]